MKQHAIHDTGEASIGNRPSHKLWAVAEGKNGSKNFWNEIGAAWAHRDGKGFNVSLKLLPTAGQKIVLRVNEPRETGGPAEDDEIPF